MIKEREMLININRNMNLINQAVDLASRYLEEEGIPESNKTIKSRIVSWYSATTTTDPYALAALAISQCPVCNFLKEAEVQRYKDFYFPQDPKPFIFVYDPYNLSTEEIEASLKDAEWRD